MMHKHYEYCGALKDIHKLEVSGSIVGVVCVGRESAARTQGDTTDYGQYFQILRTDVVMDVGNSLNPALDIGQIEGAFMQGVGLVTLEELCYSPEGVLLTRGPGAYKIPGEVTVLASTIQVSSRGTAVRLVLVVCV